MVYEVDIYIFIFIFFVIFVKFTASSNKETEQNGLHLHMSTLYHLVDVSHVVNEPKEYAHEKKLGYHFFLRNIVTNVITINLVYFKS